MGVLLVWLKAIYSTIWRNFSWRNFSALSILFVYVYNGQLCMHNSKTCVIAKEKMMTTSVNKTKFAICERKMATYDQSFKGYWG